MPKKPNAALAAHMRASPKKAAPAGSLQHLQKLGAQARDLEREIASTEERLKEQKADLQLYYQKYLPDAMDLAGVDQIGIPPTGNLPGVTYQVHPFYSASIAANWDDEKKEEAYAVLRAHNAESLIKAEVVARLPKGKLATAKKLVKAARDLKVDASLKMAVHSGTLKAWLKELYDNGHSLTQKELAKIGGSVGRTVKPQERDE